MNQPFLVGVLQRQRHLAHQPGGPLYRQRPLVGHQPRQRIAQAGRGLERAERAPRRPRPGEDQGGIAGMRSSSGGIGSGISRRERGSFASTVETTISTPLKPMFSDFQSATRRSP